MRVIAQALTLTEPPLVAVIGNVVDDYGLGHRYPVHAGGGIPRLYATATAVLAAADTLARVLCYPDPGGENVAAKTKMDLINRDAGVGENEGDLSTQVAKHRLT